MSTHSVVLGLDIATKTGWARIDGQHVRTGVVDCSPRTKDEPEGMRYRRLYDGLQDVLEGVSTVVMEEPFSRGMRTSQVLGGLIGTTLVLLEGRRIDYVFVNANTLKSFGREHGAVGKLEMQQAACEALGRDLSDDEADAWWLTRYWREWLS